VILINLLPHREERRKQRQRVFFAMLAASAVAGILVVGAGYAVLMEMTATQQARNDFLGTEIAKLDSQIRDIASVRGEIDSLKARQKAVEDLQTDRNIPVYLLDELVKQTPEGVYLTSIKQNGLVVSVTGVAQTNERVSEFLRNTQNNSPWIEKPELVEIKAAAVNTAARDQRRLFEFAMRVMLRRPQVPAGAAASAPDRKLT